MMPQTITDALELGLFGLILFIVCLPFLVIYWVWKAATEYD